MTAERPKARSWFVPSQAGGRSFRAHKAILVGRSAYFRTMLTSGFEEGACSGGELCSHVPTCRPCCTQPSCANPPHCMLYTPKHAVCYTAEARPILIDETTAVAFEALLHFVYSDALEVDDEFLVDVLRCCTCRVCRMRRTTY